jgi:hypothetical protein
VRLWVQREGGLVKPGMLCVGLCLCLSVCLSLARPPPPPPPPPPARRGAAAGGGGPPRWGCLTEASVPRETGLLRGVRVLWQAPLLLVS